MITSLFFTLFETLYSKLTARSSAWRVTLGDPCIWARRYASPRKWGIKLMLRVYRCGVKCGCKNLWLMNSELWSVRFQVSAAASTKVTNCLTARRKITENGHLLIYDLLILVLVEFHWYSCQDNLNLIEYISRCRPNSERSRKWRKH